MNRVSGRSPEDAISIMDEYIRYMVERINLSFTNISRKSGITTDEIVDRLVEDEMDITSLEGDVARVSGLVSQKLDKSAVEEDFDDESINPLQNKTVTNKFADVDSAISDIGSQVTEIIEDLDTKVRGKPFVIKHTGACVADDDVNLGSSSTLFDITEDPLGISIKNITDSTDYDAKGNVYIDDSGDVIYHTGMAITDPIITGVVFY